MKRDMELVRSLLLQIENDEVRRSELDELGKYHFKMLSDAGFVKTPRTDAPIRGGAVFLGKPELTWEGHEFLDTIRSKSVWTSIKKIAKEKGVDLSVEAIKFLAPKVIASALGPVV